MSTGKRRSWFWGREDLPGYMRRWMFWCPWFGGRSHHILRSDADPHLHDHPWSFVSWLLSGPYVEETPEGTAYHKQWSLVHKRAADLHRIILYKPVWTLVFTGPKVRHWGYQTEAGWVPWREYPKQNP